MDLNILHYFERPGLFLILSLLLIAAIGYYFVKQKNTNIIDVGLIKQVYKTSSLWQGILLVCIGMISFCSILLVSGLSTTLEKQVIKKEGIDIQIVLDMSYSMIAEDIKPRRIDAAKEMLSNFVGEMNSDRVGIVLFSGKPFQSVPLSYDYDFLQDFIADINVDIVNQATNSNLAGTALGDGLVLASDILSRDYPEREKVIILITDGEANRGVEPELALRLLKQENIKTYTIGVGKGEETTVRVPVGNYVQEIKISGVDEEILSKISYETGAEYFKADSSDTFEAILNTIAKLEKTPLEYEIYSSKKSQNITVLFLMIFSLLIMVYIYFYKKIKI